MQMTVDLTYTSPGKMHETIPSTSQLTPARSDIVSRGASEGTPGNRATTNAMTFDHEDHQPSISSNSGIVPDSAATPNSKLNTNSHDSTATGSAMANKVEKPTKKMQSKMVCDDSDDSLEELSENLDWDDDSDDDDFGGRKKPKKPKAQPKAKAKQSSSTMSSAKKKGTKNSKSAATSIESALADISCASNIPNQGTGRVSGATPLKIGDTSRNSGDDSVTTPLAETKAASHAKTAMKPTSVQQPVFAGFNSAPSRKRSTSHGPDTHNTNISSPKSSSPIRREQGMTAGSFPHLRVGLSRRGNVKPLHAYLKK
ncbi:hypothetical protein BJ742DRAFT_436635 [Cladochytrium replicatum]|nr:hypothetical protein BJ742DRAFT_436635 [Cladochytrium replicatum]